MWRVRLLYLFILFPKFTPVPLPTAIWNVSAGHVAYVHYSLYHIVYVYWVSSTDSHIQYMRCLLTDWFNCCIKLELNIEPFCETWVRQRFCVYCYWFPWMFTVTDATGSKIVSMNFPYRKIWQIVVFSLYENIFHVYFMWKYHIYVCIREVSHMWNFCIMLHRFLFAL